MPDQYIDTTYIDAFMGTALRTALFAESGTSSTVLIEAATSRVQTYLRNSGYSAPSTQTPSEVEEAIKLATMAVFWEMASQRPGASLQLPEGWEGGELKGALNDILTGSAQLAATPDVGGAVGRWKASDATSGSKTARPQRASRSQLSGF